MSVRAIASSPTRLSRKPPPTTMRSVSAQALVLRNRCGHIGEFLGEFLDRAMHQCRGMHVLARSAPRRVRSWPIASADLLPRGSSPAFFSGLRSVSRILRNAPLLARSPRKPSSSFNSRLKLSTSTDGRRPAPWRAMPVVVTTSFSHFPLPGIVSRGQRPGNPLVAWRGARLAEISSAQPQRAPNTSTLAGFQAAFP